MLGVCVLPFPVPLASAGNHGKWPQLCAGRSVQLLLPLPPLPVPCPRRSGSLSSLWMPLIWLDSHVLWPLGKVKREWAPLEVPSDRVGSVRFMFHPLRFLYLLMMSRERVRVFQMEGASCASRHLSCYSLCVYLRNCLLVTSCMRANGQPSLSPASPPPPSPPPWLPIFLFPTSDLPCFVWCLKRERFPQSLSNAHEKG